MVRRKLDRAKNKRGRSDLVDISCGYEVFDRKAGIPFEQFATRIDELMYKEKEAHHAKYSSEK